MTILFMLSPRVPAKKTPFLAKIANIDCIILQPRFYTGIGWKMASKRRMSGGSLRRWRRISIRFSLRGHINHCGCCHCSIICSGSYICCSRGDWPLKLIVFVDSEKKRFRYTPRSDFHASFDKLPYLLVEVQSEADQGNRYRMLLQAACVARFGRQSYGKPYIVVALYIENTGRVTRYLIFEDDDADAHAVCAFESKQSCVFSLVILGFLCLGCQKLQRSVRAVYYYIRTLQPGVDKSK
jgi:hypothetical protein